MMQEDVLADPIVAVVAPFCYSLNDGGGVRVFAEFLNLADTHFKGMRPIGPIDADGRSRAHPFVLKRDHLVATRNLAAALC